MFINYSMWLTEGQGRGTNENKIVHTAFLCLFSRSGFQAQQGGTVAFAVNVGQQFSGLALNNCCNTSCQCKKALADATASSPDISTFYSKILECKNEMIQSFTFISDSNNNSGTNGPRSDDTAAARDILSSNFGDSLAETAQKCNGPVCKRLVPWDEVKLSLPKDILLLPNLSTSTLEKYIERRVPRRRKARSNLKTNASQSLSCNHNSVLYSKDGVMQHMRQSGEVSG